VKDNFDWLLPRTKSADIEEAVNAYESSYHFLGGFSSSDRMVSKKISATPQSVDNRCVFYEVHQCVLNHPLCNIEQKVEWLIKPVGNLINRIHSATKRPPPEDQYKIPVWVMISLRRLCFSGRICERHG
jgi:hypothetical protein